jgi:hypothetical protein
MRYPPFGMHPFHIARAAAIALLMLLTAATVAAQAPAEVSSSEKVRANPAGQYVLVKTVVGKTLGAVDARAQPIEPETYNLLKYCWTEANALGDWAERAGLAGKMVVRALETLSWQRDLVRAGYPVEPVAQAIGRYEAALISAEFAAAAREKAVEALLTELDVVKRATPGALQASAVRNCDKQRRSLGLKYTTVPDEGRVRFIPYVLHEICQTQQLDADDPVRCDYWMNGKTDQPMAFGGETVFSVRWPDGSTATGRFDPEPLRSAGIVTLRQAAKAK